MLEEPTLTEDDPSETPARGRAVLERLVFRLIEPSREERGPMDPTQSETSSRARLRIAEMIVTPVACPDPPLLNHIGVHEATFLRAVVRLRTDDGLEGLGEGPGGGLFVQELRAVAKHVVGADPYQIERLRVLAGGNPRVFAAIESA